MADTIYASIYVVKGLTERIKMALDPTYIPQRAYKAGAAALGGVRSAAGSARGFLGRAAAYTRKAATKAMYKKTGGGGWTNRNFNESGAVRQGIRTQLRGTANRSAAAAAAAGMGPPEPFVQPSLRRTRRRNHTRKGRKAGRR